jgi:hypothetical protein
MQDGQGMITFRGGQLQGRSQSHGGRDGGCGVAGALPIEGGARHPQAAAGTHHADLLAQGRSGDHQGLSVYAGGLGSSPSKIETFFGRQ